MKTDDDDFPTPRQNPDLIGHGWAEQRFLAAWASGRLPHAWLICGPRGIGKATFAHRAARFLLANPQPDGGDDAGLFGEPETPALPETLHVDPDSPVFRRAAAGGHADLLTVERTPDPRRDDKKLRTEITAGDVRPAAQFLRLTPAEGGWRVVVVDCADELNPTAANALLKMLEEPPARAVLLLVSHAPGRLLATIRSRCCRLTLRPLDEAAVLSILERQRPEVAAADRQGLARLAEGSPGRAVALADEGGLALYRDMIALFGTLPGLDIAGLHDFGTRLARPGQEASFRTATELMGWWLARMIHAGARGGEPPPVIPEEQGCNARLLAAGGLDRWVEVWEKIGRLADQTGRLNLDRKQSVLGMFHALQSAMTG